MIDKVDWKLVIVESPLSGDVEANNKYLDRVLADCYRRHESPFASHVIGPHALNDLDPEERAAGMSAGRAWYRAAELMVVYVDRGISLGMLAGIEEANRIGLRWITRRLDNCRRCALSAANWCGCEAADAIGCGTVEASDLLSIHILSRGA